MTLDDEIRRASGLLEALMLAAGTPRQKLEALLEVPPGYLDRLVEGQVELKLRHILAVLNALEVEPAAFFQALYPSALPASGSVSMEALHDRLAALGVDREPEPEPEVEPEELERLIQEAIRNAAVEARFRDEEA